LGGLLIAKRSGPTGAGLAEDLGGREIDGGFDPTSALNDQQPLALISDRIDDLPWHIAELYGGATIRAAKGKM
jgi:hypothetical protein